jgi:hypothetical protein
MNGYLYIAGGNKLYKYDIINDNISTIFIDKNNETLMGLCIVGDFLYLGGKTSVFRFKIIEDKIERINEFKINMYPAFHQINYNEINNSLYITCTQLNQIWRVSLNLKDLIDTFIVDPPAINEPIVYKKNYNHINNIYFLGNYAYITLNWLTNKQYDSSGVAVLNRYTMKEFDRFEYGWETHNFCIINNVKYALCGSSGYIRKVNHIHKAGLLVNNELVFQHSPNEVFCKDFSIDDDNIYIVGGEVGITKERFTNDGVLYILDRNYKLLHKRVFDKSGGFCGCLLNKIDYTK